MPGAIWRTSLVSSRSSFQIRSKFEFNTQFYCTCSALGTTDMKYLSRIRRSPSDTEGNPALSGNIRTGFPDFVKPPDKEMIFITQHKVRRSKVLTNLGGPQCSSWPDAGHHGDTHWVSSPWTGQASPGRGARDSGVTRVTRPGSCSSGAAAAAWRTSCCPGPGARAGPAGPGQTSGAAGGGAGDAPWAWRGEDLVTGGSSNFLQWSCVKVLILYLVV